MKIIFLLAFIILASALPSQLVYQVNQEYVFNVNGYLDAKGALSNSEERTSGSFSTMNGTLAIQCVQVNSDNYMFVMNMFNVVVGVGQGEETPSELKSMSPPGSGDTPLGYDVYYQQFFNGSIPTIWYNTADSPYYVNVKIGAINAMQTKIVAPSQQELVTFSDPIGVHTSLVAGAVSSNFLVLQNTFDQTNIVDFSDTNVHPNMVLLTAETVTQIHPDGYIYGSNVNQYVNMVDMSPAGESQRRQRKRKDEATDETGFNMDMSSKGSLSVALCGANTLKDKNGMIHNVFNTIQELQGSKDYSSGSLTEVTRVTIQKQKLESSKADVVGLFTKAVSIPFKQRNSSYFRSLSQVVDHLKIFPSDLSLLSPFFPKFASEATLPDTMFYVLTRVGSEAAQALISRFGLNIAKESIQMSALFSVSSIETPSHDLMTVLLGLVKSKNENLSAHALYALTNLIRKCNIESVRDNIKQLLLKRLNLGVKHKNVICCLSTLLAIKNAGGSFFIQRNQIPYALLVQFNHLSINAVLSQMYPYSSVASLPPTAFNFPFNRSIDESKKLGGSVASITFNADLFAGSNFDCNQPTFNYEANAEASADGSLFGIAFQALNAQAIYGKANGAVVGDSMFLQVFGKTIYSKTFPVLDCNMHNYPLAHASPGFSVSYTVWVSIIPITFTASTDLALNLAWGWEVCDSPLLLEVELVPTATLTFAGNAVIDLLILRAGIVLDANFNSALIPQGKVLGSECALDFDIEYQSVPASSSFDAYYEWKECKYLIFDCHWGTHHQTQIWGYTEPAHSEVVFNEQYKIANFTKN